MANDSSAPSTTAWPLPKFLFEVKWDQTVMRFQEVSGLVVDPQPIDYRHIDSPQFSILKMPGIKKYGDITLKKGVFKSDNKFWDWFNELKTNALKRRPVTISLLDEAGSPTLVWTLANAWPSKISGTELNSTGNEVSVETIVVVHEGLTIAM